MRLQKHVLLDMNPQKGLIVRLHTDRGLWVYDVLWNGELFSAVDASIIDSDWRLWPKLASNDITEQSN